MTTTPHRWPAPDAPVAPDERTAPPAPETPDEAPAAPGASSQAEAAQPTAQAMKAAEKILLALGCNAGMRRMVALEIDSWIDLPALFAERESLKRQLLAAQDTIEGLETGADNA